MIHYGIRNNKKLTTLIGVVMVLSTISISAATELTSATVMEGMSSNASDREPSGIPPISADQSAENLIGTVVLEESVVEESSPLHLASESGNAAEVKSLLGRGDDVDAINASGETPFEVAVMFKHFDIAQVLVEAGANVLKLDADGQDALSSSLARGQLDLAATILSKITKTPEGLASLDRGVEMAARGGYWDFAWTLLDSGADLNRGESSSSNALYYASLDNNLEVIQALVKRGVNPNTRFDGEVTALMVAAGNGYLDQLTLLKNLGATLSSTDAAGSTALHWAALNNHLDVMRLLISEGIDVNKTNVNGFTPLMMSVVRGNEEIFRSLMAEHAALEIKDKAGRTALAHAVENGQTPIVKALLIAGAEVDALNMNNETPLMRSAYMGFYQISKDLLAYGAKINSQNVFGTTPLMFAVSSGKIHIVDLLMNNQADPGIKESKNLDAFSMAKARGYKKIYKLLQGEKLTSKGPVSIARSAYQDDDKQTQ